MSHYGYRSTLSHLKRIISKKDIFKYDKCENSVLTFFSQYYNTM